MVRRGSMQLGRMSSNPSFVCCCCCCCVRVELIWGIDIYSFASLALEGIRLRLTTVYALGTIETRERCSSRTFLHHSTTSLTYRSMIDDTQLQALSIRIEPRLTVAVTDARLIASNRCVYNCSYTIKTCISHSQGQPQP
jgi:hypothetical protein